MCSLCFTAQEFGLFLSDEDPKKGVWLESARTLEYYLLRNGVRGTGIILQCRGFHLFLRISPWCGLTVCPLSHSYTLFKPFDVFR